jgi:predicted dienelactone hydrolase
MRPSALLCLFIVGIAISHAYAADTVGFRKIALPQSPSGRALEVAIWYPAEAGGTPISIGENAVFYGLAGSENATPEPGRHPFVVMSHGFPGNWSNQDWLADALAKHGYIVAAPNHPGTTTGDVRPISATNGIWERPRDISYLISALVADPSWSSLIDVDRIAAVGHSMGGWTVMELAGARSDGARFETECREHPTSASCNVMQSIGFFDPSIQKSNAPLMESFKDERIKAFVTLDLGLARGFDPATLAKIDRPVLVISSGPNVSFSSKIQSDLNSKYMADLMPPTTTHYLQIKDVAHFSFLPVCKPNASARLGDDAFLCEDGGGRDRDAIHQQVSDEVIHFLAVALQTR